MLEGPVAGALNVENFSEISEKAVLQDLQRLKGDFEGICAAFLVFH